MNSRHERTVKIDRALDRRIWQNLRATRAESRQYEDNTISVTAIFDDGCQVDVKCCGSQDEPSWAEAVLFDRNGRELGFTEPAETFTGEWELTCDGDVYVVRVETEPGPDRGVERASAIAVGAGVFVVRYIDEHVDDDNVLEMIREAATAHYARNPNAFERLGGVVTVATALGVMTPEETERFGFHVVGPDDCRVKADPCETVVDPVDVPETED